MQMTCMKEINEQKNVRFSVFFNGKKRIDFCHKIGSLRKLV